MTAELNEKRLKSACKMFREKQNEKFAREQAAKDLNVLYGVVDKSVMTYHQGEFTCFYLGMTIVLITLLGTYAIHALHCPIGHCSDVNTNNHHLKKYMAIHLFCQISSVFYWLLLVAGYYCWPVTNQNTENLAKSGVL